MSDQRRTVHPDFLVGVVLFAVGAALFLHTFDPKYDFDLLFGDVSTVFAPRLVLVLWMALSLVLIVGGLRGRGDPEDRARLGSIAVPRLLLVLGVTTGSALLLWATGLLIGGSVLMVAVGLAMGYRRLVVLLPVSIAVPVALWFALGRVARIALPAGVLWD